MMHHEDIEDDLSIKITTDTINGSIYQRVTILNTGSIKSLLEEKILNLRYESVRASLKREGWVSPEEIEALRQDIRQKIIHEIEDSDCLSRLSHSEIVAVANRVRARKARLVEVVEAMRGKIDESEATIRHLNFIIYEYREALSKSLYRVGFVDSPDADSVGLLANEIINLRRNTESTNQASVEVARNARHALQLLRQEIRDRKRRAIQGGKDGAA